MKPQILLASPRKVRIPSRHCRVFSMLAAGERLHTPGEERRDSRGPAGSVSGKESLLRRAAPSVPPPLWSLRVRFHTGGNPAV